MFPGTYVPRYLCSPNLCSPVPMFPGTDVPRTYVPRYLCSPNLCSPVPIISAVNGRGRHMLLPSGNAFLSFCLQNFSARYCIPASDPSFFLRNAAVIA